jgi:hypothetical protein
LATSRRELSAVARLLEDESNEELDSLQMAQKIIDVVDDLREKAAKWGVVGELEIHETSEHEAVKGIYFVGPFSTELKAEQAGVGLAHDSRQWSSRGVWHKVPIVSSARSAWDAMKPRHRERFEHIREYIKEQEIATFGEEWFAEKRGW